MLKTYEYRLYPNKKQEELLAKHFGCVRLVYNKALELKEKLWKEEKKHLSYESLCKELTKWKQTEEFSFLYEVSNPALQQSLRHLDSSYKRYFDNYKKNGNKIKYKKKSIERQKRESNYIFTTKDIESYPRFKNKRSKQSYSVIEHCYVLFNENKVKIPKFQEGIKAKIHRTFEGKIKTCTIKKSTTGKYYISVLVDNSLPLPNKETVETNKTVGIDLGIKSFITISNNEKVDSMKFLDSKLKRLQVLSKRASKKVKGSNNQKKAYKRISILHEKISNRRKDFIHKLTYKLTHDNQVSCLCVENLNVKGMVKNKHLSRSINDVAWSEFIRQLQYKCDWYGKSLLFVDTFYPSSKTCSCCGYVNENLTLKDREWICPNCNTKHDRDINASINIKNEALKQYLAGLGKPEVLVELSTKVEALKQEIFN